MRADLTIKLGRARESHLPTVEIDRHRLRPSTTAPVVNPPGEADVSGPIPDDILGMLGNDEYGDCGPAATEHGRDFKALVEMVNGEPKFTEGFRYPHEAYTVWLYSQYLTAMGSSLKIDPGVVNSEWLLFLYQASKQQDDVVAFAEEPSSASAAQVLQDMIDFRGMLVGVELDQFYNQEFNENVPFGTLSTTPDPSLGHDMYWVGYSPQGWKFCTWGTYMEALPLWVVNCVQEKWVFMTKEEAETAGVDWESLTKELDSLVDAHPILSTLDYSKFGFDSFWKKAWAHLEVMLPSVHEVLSQVTDRVVLLAILKELAPLLRGL